MNIICDTSVIVNFLNRLDLLSRCYHTFWMSEHVHQEIALDYPAFQIALEKSPIQKIDFENPQELDLFIELIKNKRLSIGECSTIAIAACRGYFLAIERSYAMKKAKLLVPSYRILSTQDIVEEIYPLSDDNLLQETSLRWGIFPFVLKAG